MKPVQEMPSTVELVRGLAVLAMLVLVLVGLLISAFSPSSNEWVAVKDAFVCRYYLTDRWTWDRSISNAHRFPTGDDAYIAALRMDDDSNAVYYGYNIKTGHVRSKE